MSDNYYIFAEDQPKGPYSINQLYAMWRAGAVSSQAYICREGNSEWVLLSTLEKRFLSDAQHLKSDLGNPARNRGIWLIGAAVLLGLFAVVSFVVERAKSTSAPLRFKEEPPLLLARAKISEDTKSRILALLEKATKLSALTAQGVSHDAFADQLAEIKSSWDTLRVSGWPGDWSDAKEDLELAITGWDLANSIWTVKLRPDAAFNFENVAGREFGPQLRDYCAAVLDHTSQRSLVDQFGLVSPIPNYVDKDKVIPWCMTAASACFERAKNLIAEDLKT